jgi:hypothetical protein
MLGFGDCIKNDCMIEEKKRNKRDLAQLGRKRDSTAVDTEGRLDCEIGMVIAKSY